MAISLAHGVYTGALGLAGAGAVVIAPNQIWVGYALFASAILLGIWGLRINERHIWQPWWRGNSSPKLRSFIGLDDALKYIAFDSLWAKNRVKDEASYPADVSNALRSALANGEIVSRGRYYHNLEGGAQNHLHPKINVDLDYWRENNINAWWALNDQSQAIGGRKHRNGMPPRYNEHDGQFDIDLDEGRLRELWPPAKR